MHPVHASTGATAQAIPPTWKATGATGANWALAKAGVVLLTYAKGLGASGRPKLGEARFDWSNKQVGASASLPAAAVVQHRSPTSDLWGCRRLHCRLWSSARS